MAPLLPPACARAALLPACAATSAKGSFCPRSCRRDRSWAALPFKITAFARLVLAILAGAIALAFMEYALDMESIDESGDPGGDVGRHRHGADHVAAALEYRFPLGRIGSDLRQLQLGTAIGPTQRDPDARLAVCKVVAIIRGVRTEQVDAGGARVVGRLTGLVYKHGPWRRRGHFLKDAQRRPGVIDPWIVDRAAAQHHADFARPLGHRHRRPSIDHATCAAVASGNPTSRFCGFSRTILSGPIARMR